MSDQIRQAREASTEVYWAFQGTREGGHSCISVGTITKFIRCPLGVPRLHASEVYSRSSSCSGFGERLLLTLMGPSRRDQCVS